MAERKKRGDSEIGTRERILEAAKEQFAVHGFEQASVRTITQRADANSAMLRYYFGSKDELFREVIRSILGGIVGHRLAALAALRRDHDGPLPLDALLRAYVAPILQDSLPLHRDAAVYLRFFGRLYTEPTDRLRDLIQSQLTDVQTEFIREIGRSVPHVDHATLSFRFGLLMGSLAFIGAKVGVVELLSGEAVGAASGDAVIAEFVRDFRTLFETSAA